jgi:hypothetical protein
VVNGTVCKSVWSGRHQQQKHTQSHQLLPSIYTKHGKWVPEKQAIFGGWLHRYILLFSSQAKGRLTATGGSHEPNMAGVTSSTLTGGRGRVLPPVVGVGVVWAKQEEGKAGGKDYFDWQL